MGSDFAVTEQCSDRRCSYCQFSITVDQNSGNLDVWTVVNGYLATDDGLATLTNSTALVTGQYVARAKADAISSGRYRFRRQ